jgi:hypothetical protein
MQHELVCARPRWYFALHCPCFDLTVLCCAVLCFAAHLLAVVIVKEQVAPPLGLPAAAGGVKACCLILRVCCCFTARSCRCYAAGCSCWHAGCMEPASAALRQHKVRTNVPSLKKT